MSKITLNLGIFNNTAGGIVTLTGIMRTAVSRAASAYSQKIRATKKGEFSSPFTVHFYFAKSITRLSRIRFIFI